MGHHRCFKQGQFPDGFVQGQRLLMVRILFPRQQTATMAGIERGHNLPDNGPSAFRKGRHDGQGQVAGIQFIEVVSQGRDGAGVAFLDSEKQSAKGRIPGHQGSSPFLLALPPCQS
jgi:hypothetical protein